MPRVYGHIPSPKSPDDPIFDHEVAKASLKATAVVPANELPYLSWRHFIPPRNDQNERGDCTGETARNFRMTMQAINGGTALALSPTWIYREGRAAEGTLNQDAGAMPIDILKTMMNVGFVLWADYVPNYAILQTEQASAPALARAAKWKISSYARVTQTMDAIKVALARGPVYMGFTVPANMETDPRVSATGILDMPDRPIGGHAVCLIGWIDNPNAPGGGYAIFVNSWSSKWGDDGLGYMPYAMLTDPQWVSDLWTATAPVVSVSADDYIYSSLVWSHLEPPAAGQKNTSDLLPLICGLLNHALGLVGKERLEVTSTWNNDIGNALSLFQNTHCFSATQEDPNIVVGVPDRYTLEALLAVVFPTDKDGTIV